MGNLVLRSIRLFYSAMSCDDPEADYGAHQSDGESVVDDGPKLKPVSFLVNDDQNDDYEKLGGQVPQINRTQIGRWRLYGKNAVVCDDTQTLEERNFSG